PDRRDTYPSTHPFLNLRRLDTKCAIMLVYGAPLWQRGPLRYHTKIEESEFMKRICALMVALAVLISMTVIPGFAQDKKAAGKDAKTEQKADKKADTKKADTKDAKKTAAGKDAKKAPAKTAKKADAKDAKKTDKKDDKTATAKKGGN